MVHFGLFRISCERIRGTIEPPDAEEDQDPSKNETSFRFILFGPSEYMPVISQLYGSIFTSGHSPLSWQLSGINTAGRAPQALMELLNKDAFVPAGLYLASMSTYDISLLALKVSLKA